MTESYERPKARKAIFWASISILIVIFVVIALMIASGGSGSGEGALIVAGFGSLIFLIGSIFLFFTWIISASFKLAKIDFDPFKIFEEIEFIRENKGVTIFLSFLVTFSVFAILEDSLHMKKEQEKLDQKK